MFSARNAVELDISKLTWFFLAILLGKTRALVESVHWVHGHGTEDRKAHDRIPETVPRQTADWTGELVLNVLWSYVKVQTKI